MTQEKPFVNIKRDPQVLVYRSQGGRPLRPENEEVRRRGLDDQLWTLLERCWSDRPDNRPSIKEVIEVLETLPPPVL